MLEDQSLSSVTFPVTPRNVLQSRSDRVSHDFCKTLNVYLTKVITAKLPKGIIKNQLFASVSHCKQN